MKKLFLTLTLILSLAINALSAQYEGTCYVMHSSGMHIAKGSSGAVLESAAAAQPQAMTIVATSDGYYNIMAPDGTYLAKSGANAWNTGFIEAATGDVAKFSIEPSGVFVRLKNKSNGKYLGTDNVTAGSAIYCDKNGSDTKHLWYFASNPDDEVPVAVNSVIVNPDARRQTFEGFGVSLCWWAHMCGQWDDDKIDEIVDWLVSPEHLNYKVFRYNIGGGDDPDNAHCDPHHMAKGKGIRAEIPGYKATETSEYDWNADSAQIKIMLKIKEKRPDAVFEAFSNSAPWWMTNSGCCAGANSGSSDNLKPEYYEAFCHYLVDVCKHIKEKYGIEFRSLEPFNEPMSTWWTRNGGQEGCHFSVNSQIALVKTLYPILKESGLNTVISASDENDISQQVKDFTQYAAADALRYLGQINAHTYNGNVNACSNMIAQCRDAGLPLWMSEVGSGGTGIQGNLTMAAHLVRDMRYMEPEVWCDWQYIEEGNDQWCLLQANFAKATYTRANHFYVRQHISKYITPGSTILTSTSDNTLLAQSPDGKTLTLIVVNAEGAPADYRVDLGMYSEIGSPEVAAWSTSNSYFNDLEHRISDSYLTFRMPALSIATIVMPASKADAADDEIIYGDRYLILPRNNNSVAVAAQGTKVLLQPAELSPSMIWTVKGDAGAATFTNDEGISMLGADSYYLQTTEAEGSAFTVEHVDGNYYKISLGARSFDLEGEKSASGTALGLWEYGTSPAASHRQFMMLRLAERSSLTPDAEGIADALKGSSASISSIPGVIRVTGEAGCAASVYTLDGRLVHTATMLSDSVDIPVRAGVYIATCCGKGISGSAVVIVR